MADDWVPLTLKTAVATFDHLQREAMQDALAWLDELHVTPAQRAAARAQAAALAAAPA